MGRRDELIKYVGEDMDDLVTSLVDDMVFLEERLSHLRTLPFIRVNKDNPEQQKATPASKLYKESLQQYVNCIKVIEGIVYKDKRLDDTEVEESPLRKWFNDHAN